MPSIETLTAFLLASTLLGLAPGPDNLYVIAQSLQHGRRAGLWVTLGLCSGLVLHTLAVALGVAALLATSATAFNLLKGLGAAYLLYLAWRAFTAAHTGNITTASLSGLQLYRRGILMNLTNPKVSIFFLAFLPQFADPDRGAVTLQLMLLGGLFILVTLVVFGALAAGASTLGQRLRGSATVQKRLNQLAGGLFVALSIHLLTSSRTS